MLFVFIIDGHEEKDTYTIKELKDEALRQVDLYGISQLAVGEKYNLPNGEAIRRIE